LEAKFFKYSATAFNISRESASSDTARASDIDPTSALNIRATGPHPRRLSGRQNGAGAGDRRVGWQRGDATGARPGRKTCDVNTTSPAKAGQAKVLGFNEVIDTSVEKLGDGVRGITGGYGADIVIDGIGGEVLGEALATLAPGGRLTTLGYSASRKATIDVTNLIWQRASIQSFVLFAEPQAALAGAWNTIVSLPKSGAIKPLVAKTFPLAEAADALR
jgi:hypothetical protein